MQLFRPDALVISKALIAYIISHVNDAAELARVSEFREGGVLGMRMRVVMLPDL